MSLKLKIVLTGGIASGKSSVCKMLQDVGFAVIDADNAAHAALAKNVSKIGEIFGAEFIKNGAVDRQKLGALVFKDARKREILERLLHDDILYSIEKQAREYEAKNVPYIADIPLFFERKNSYEADTVALVYAKKEQQLYRLIKRGSISEDEALDRINAQMDIEKKREMADIIIDNTKNSAHLKREVEKFIVILKEKYGLCDQI